MGLHSSACSTANQCGSQARFQPAECDRRGVGNVHIIAPKKIVFLHFLSFPIPVTLWIQTWQPPCPDREGEGNSLWEGAEQEDRRNLGPPGALALRL